MSLLFANNAISTLAAGIGTGDTSLTVQAADGLLFPSPSGNDTFLCTLSDASNNIEIVEVTNKSSDTFTIVRAREGTTAKAYLSGDSVELRITAGVLSQYRQGVGDKVTDVGINTAVGLSQAHDIINCTTGGLTITLADAATMGEGYQITVKNQGATAATITRATPADLMDGVAADIGVPAGGTVYLSVNAAEDGYISMFSGVENYPVGALYFSYSSSTNPNSILGYGTWSAIPGRFLVGVGDNGDGKAYAQGETGGSKDAVVVAHQHGSAGAHNHTVNLAAIGSSEGGNGDLELRQQNTTTSTNGAHQHPSEGESGTDKNNPAYQAVYIWRRTA